MMNIKLPLTAAMVLGSMLAIGTACDGSASRNEASTAQGIAAGTSSDASGDERRVRFASGGQEFDAVIETPAPSRRNHWGVVLIGGGMGNDLDWTAPGSIVADGSDVQVTISGKPHADAPAISRALAEQGFTVLRWSTIAVGDPLADQWPIKATPRTQKELLEQAKAAVAALRRDASDDARQVILIGHSLGAARAWNVAVDDPQVRGLVLLSPAYFTTGGNVPRAFADAKMRLGEDAVKSRPVPCLAIFGSLDSSRVVNAAGASALAGTPGFEHLDVRVIDGLGHQLGPQEGALMGPISGDVVTTIARWAGDLARR